MAVTLIKDISILPESITHLISVKIWVSTATRHLN